jgi:hypothetical protein
MFSWYFLVTVATFGILAWVPFVHALSRLRRRWIAMLTLVYLVAGTVEMVLLFLAPTNSAGQSSTDDTVATIGGLLLLAIVISAVVLQAVLVSEIRATPQRPVAQPVPPDIALTTALAARARRDEARQLARTDPLLARDLRIGRPDLPHTYEDGGLVDINSAPAPVISKISGLPPEMALDVVSARENTGGFLAVDDVFSMVDIPISYWDALRDRSIVIPQIS